MKGTDSMIAKEYLSELAALQVKIQQKQEQKQMFLDMATSITASINPIKVQSSSTVDRTGEAVAKAADMDAVIEAEVERLWYRQHEIVKEIQALRNAKYIQLLFKVYVQGKSIRGASIEMKMSYQYVRELHKKALAEFERVHADILNEIRTA